AALERIAATRRLVLRAAGDVEADPDRGYLASAAKLAATDLARAVCDRLPGLLGPGALLDHPLLEKWWRDVAAFEFMEGTSHIQKLNVTHRALSGEAAAVRAATVPAGTVSAGTVSAGTVSAGTVSAGTVSAGTVSAGTGEEAEHG
ncbi:acyl-CoA dehydrogenase family protein, partial [Actinomadura roseirufa]|uniref:acyl-CoA dehydrogenase family protein n=1 Tax=Actinomadura roseirufa TaxID=2094049 RepID=UPI0013F17348